MDDYEPMIMLNDAQNIEPNKYKGIGVIRKKRIKDTKKIFEKAIIFGIAFITICFIIWLTIARKANEDDMETENKVKH